MALETLKDVTEIGGYPVFIEKDGRPDKVWESQEDAQAFFQQYDNSHPIWIDHPNNSITFKIQDGPIKDVKIKSMEQDFMYYLAQINSPENGAPEDWDSEELHAHAKKCIAENSQDWKDFNDKFGKDYTGVNGCQVDTMIEAARLIISGLNEKFPCRENSIAITKLDEAIMWLEKRKKDREKRNVEGTSNI